jgi:hypothetical protein
MQQQELHTGDRVEATRGIGVLPRVPPGSRGTVVRAGVSPLEVEFDEFTVDMRMTAGPGRKPTITRKVRPDQVIRVGGPGGRP